MDSWQNVARNHSSSFKRDFGNLRWECMWELVHEVRTSVGQNKSQIFCRHTAQLCLSEMKHISIWFQFDWSSIATYCYDKGMPILIIERIFANNLVRQSSGDCLDVVDVARMLFAMVGTDERQSFEYWFRVLDVQSAGVLSCSDLHDFYKEISQLLSERNITSLPFENVITQYCDILGTTTWTLQTFKKNASLAGRVINGFVNAFRFLEQEMDESEFILRALSLFPFDFEETNAERLDDENFGEGRRTRWQRMIDHEYDCFYRPESSTSSDNSSFPW